MKSFQNFVVCVAYFRRSHTDYGSQEDDEATLMWWGTWLKAKRKTWRKLVVAEVYGLVVMTVP